MKNYKLIVFDVDGVLVDSFDRLYASANIFVKNNNGKELTEDRYRELMIGNPWENLLAEAGLEKREKLEPLENERDYDFYYKTPLFNGIEPLIKELSKRMPLAVITSTYIEQVKKLLEKRGVDACFSAFLGPEISLYKHDKLKMVLEEYDALPEEILFITDTVGDIKEAQKISVPTIAVTWGFHTKEQLQSANPDHLIESVSELKTFLLS